MRSRRTSDKRSGGLDAPRTNYGEAGPDAAGVGRDAVRDAGDGKPPAEPDGSAAPFDDAAPGPFHSPGTPGIVVPYGVLAGRPDSGCASTADATGTGSGPLSLAVVGVASVVAWTGAGATECFTGAFALCAGSGVFVNSPVTQSETRVHPSLYQWWLSGASNFAFASITFERKARENTSPTIGNALCAPCPQ